MKNLFAFFMGLIFCIPVFSQTYGHLYISVSTSETGGNYAPRNIVAIWIENDNGEFIKTLMAYAQNRKTHLNIWQASTSTAGVEFNDVDAITGPTRNSHATRECLWNALDYNQNLMPDGVYHIWMELTDKNGTGNYSSFSFNKGEEPEELTPDNVPSFSDISISWEPSGTGIEEAQKLSYSIKNNPGHGIFELLGDTFDEIEILSISGRYVDHTSSNIIDISEEPNGVYLLRIKHNEALQILKIVKE